MKSNHTFTTTALRCLLLCIGSGLVTILFLVGVVLVLATRAHAETAADTTADPEPRYLDAAEVQRGSLLFYGEEGFTSAPVLHTDVHMDVTGMIARARVRQEFRNTGTQWQEGIYVFPLPETAAVDHLTLHIGERLIEGRVRERQQARQEYRQARQAGRKAGLVEQERPNIFTTSVANIGPGEAVTVEIEYQQEVGYEQGGFSLRFPLVVAPRYIPGTTRIQGFAGSGWSVNTDQVADAARITPPVPPPGTGPENPVVITLQVDAGFRLQQINSLYHPVAIENSGTRYRVSMQSGAIPADRDFVLNWRPATGAAPAAALFRETVNGDDYALLMVLPPAREQVRTLHREIILVIDTSGSMAGTSIAQAKAALDLAVVRLQPGDYFNIIQFNSHTAQLFRAPRPATAENLEQARYYIHALDANGGTEMAAAIHAALQRQERGTALRQVVFLTDGSVGNEDALFGLIERLLGDSRLFTIGIGSAPNSHFMQRAAVYGRGTHTYIGDLREVQRQMSRLFRKLESPLLADVALAWPDAAAVESWPARIPDLYQDEPLLVSLRADQLPDQLRITGRIAGSPWQADVSLRGGEARPGIGVLWARKKIAALMDAQRRATEDDGIRRQIIDTALEHHLVSRYTSLVAVDVTPAREPGQALHSRAVPVKLPAGWRYDKVFGAMPRTATPAGRYLLTGAGLLLLSLLLAGMQPAAQALASRRGG